MCPHTLSMGHTAWRTRSTHTCSLHTVDLPRPVGAELITAWVVPSLRLETYHFTKCSKHSHEYSCSVYECYCEVSTAGLANVFSYQDYFRIVEVDTCNSKHITHVRLGILSERKLTFFPLLRLSAHTPTNPQTYNHTHTHMYTHTILVMLLGSQPNVPGWHVAEISSQHWSVL